eukprot:255957_1
MSLKSSETLSNKDFIINMMNTCIGIGLLAKPFAVMVSGWYSIIAIMSSFLFVFYASWLFAHVTMRTYGISVNNNPVQYEMVNVSSASDLEHESDFDSGDTSTDNNVDNSTKSVYQNIAYKALGKYGEYYINITLLSIMPLVGINIIVIQFQLIRSIIQYFLSSSPFTPFYFNDQYIFLYISIFLLPFIFISSWKELKFISIISVLSVCVLVFTMCCIFILRLITFQNGNIPSDYYEHSNYIITEDTARYTINNMNLLQRIFFSFIIFKSGIQGTIAIPSLIVSLKDKRAKNIMFLIFISYLIVTICCVSFGVIGAITYGSNVSVLILNNVFVWPSTVYVVIVAALKTINLWTSYPVFVSFCCNTLNKILNIQQDHQHYHMKIYITRFAYIVITTVSSFLFRYRLAFVTAVCSGFGFAFGFAFCDGICCFFPVFCCGTSVGSFVATHC